MIELETGDGLSEEYVARQHAKAAVTIRAARAALGISQQELADSLGLSKSTIARIETLEMQPKFDVYVGILAFFKREGIEIPQTLNDGVVMQISPKALDTAKRFLDDETKRRADRKKSHPVE